VVEKRIWQSHFSPKELPGSVTSENTGYAFIKQNVTSPNWGNKKRNQ
jgi:hypothetical protein